MYPALDQVLAFAENPEYSFCPLSLAVCSDMLTPVSLMRVLQSEHKVCFLLESATQDMHWGRWSFLGYDPECEVTVLDGAVFLRGRGEKHSRKTEHAAPFEYLRGILEKHKSPSVENMPHLRAVWSVFLRMTASNMRNPVWICGQRKMRMSMTLI